MRLRPLEKNRVKKVVCTGPNVCEMRKYGDASICERCPLTYNGKDEDIRNIWRTK